MKSLLQFRSVSKSWKSLIDSSDFITAYSSFTQPQPQRLLITYEDFIDNMYKCVSINENDTNFPEKVSSLTVPESVDLSNHSIVGTSSHGLFCFYGFSDDSATGTAVIWNPAIRKSVAIDVPGVFDDSYAVVGFGVCPDTLDPKIVKFTNGAPCQVDVFTLSTGFWRSPLCSNNLPCEPIESELSVVIDRFIHWLAYDCNQRIYMLMLFDLISEKFSEQYLPDCLAHKGLDLSISNQRESLVVLESNCEGNKSCYGVWKMTEDSASISFKKLYNISEPYALRPEKVKRVLGFKKSGETIIVMEKNLQGRLMKSDGLFVYDPYTKNIEDLWIAGQIYSFFVNSYMETLLLLDHLQI